MSQLGRTSMAEKFIIVIWRRDMSSVCTNHNVMSVIDALAEDTCIKNDGSCPIVQLSKTVACQK